MLWKDALYDYQMYLKLEKRVSANTIEGYLRDIQKLINYSDKQPLDYSQDDLRDFVHDFASSEYSVRSQARVISGLKSFLATYNSKILEKIIRLLCSKLQKLG